MREGETTRGCAEASVGHLPEPLRSGECLGVDLKTTAPESAPGANRCVVLLAADFAPGKVFARGAGFGKVTIQEAPSRLVGDFVKTDDPPVILGTDDGGLFNTALDQLV